MKRLIAFILSAAAALVLSGCGAQLPQGYDEVKQAKQLYQELDSAHITMTDNTTGTVIMDFSFYINHNNEMVLSYYGVDDGREQHAYSNGAEYFYKEHDDEKWSVIGTEDENYIYNLYNREYRYPYAQGGIFFLDAGSVENAEVIASDDSPTQITYIYDTDKLNRSAVEYLDGVSSFGSLETTFVIDENGYITEFSERGTVTDTEGIDEHIDMSIIVDGMNEVYDIPYPVDEVYARGEKPIE